jgi:hypothetical protein
MNQTQDPVPFTSNSYVAFDGTSIRDIIINRLNQGQVFTDQNYQGSNLSALIDIISYTFNTLLYYLNKTSSESLFSEAQVYENMNRIVKLLGYNPVGRLGQNVAFDLYTNGNLPLGNYFIPRYSYVSVGGTFYSTNKDISFSVLTTGAIQINDVSNSYLLYQGLFQEYPLYSAAGVDNEVLFLALNSNTYIDHHNIFVYVLPSGSNTWQQWTNVDNLFTYSANDTVYTVRFNENQNYEISFGDGVNGVKLNQGDQVAIYYLKIDQNAVGIGPNTLNNSTIVPFNSVQYAKILTDTSFNLETLVSTTQLTNLSLNNQYPSNVYTNFESVDAIRNAAPNAFRSQYRLVTVNDYKNYISSNFSNIISDAAVVNNDDYLAGHIKYLYDIGLNQPQIQNQVLLNQIKFANSCNFNNIYLYAVPNNYLQDYISPPQKELIIDSLNSTKTMTSNIVVVDPVYMNLDFYIASPTTLLTTKDINLCKLQIIQSPTSGRASSSIVNDVVSIFNSFFNTSVNKLGQLIDIYQITSQILAIDGVKGVQTYRSDTNTSVNGVSLLVWNDLYPTQDISVHSQNVNLQYFQYPIFNNLTNIASRVEVIQSTQTINPVDF